MHFENYDEERRLPSFSVWKAREGVRLVVLNICILIAILLSNKPNFPRRQINKKTFVFDFKSLYVQ